ncbi:MAG: class I SAM-dependent methyltransferase [Gammaproteobacteria bacterium]|nr:class I SAM-dependent methyltransferase [Gammaproteobacteria bacterium]
MSDARKQHWEGVYSTKAPDEVSWFQPVPALSLQLIEATGVGLDEPVLDAGGGASTLVDSLLDLGYTNLTVLDISAAALATSRDRLGSRADSVSWIESDVTEFIAPRRYALWHDRAVFHFLTSAADRVRYTDVVRSALCSGGHLVLSTFGPEGPLRCSGLEIRRYGIEQLHEIFDENFALRQHLLDEHRTPGGAVQQFIYTRWQLKA